MFQVKYSVYGHSADVFDLSCSHWLAALDVVPAFVYNEHVWKFRQFVAVHKSVSFVSRNIYSNLHTD